MTKKKPVKAEKIALLVRDILMSMEHTYDPYTGNHIFVQRSPLVITDRLKCLIDSLIA